MSSEHAELIQRADQADTNGDVAAMLEYIDPSWSGPIWILPWRTRPRRSATAARSLSRCCGAGS
jgi:hypothetical protein